MSYFPYVKGEFYDLYAFRDTAELLARRRFTPIIEPVNEYLGGLAPTIEILNLANVTPVVVVNPEFCSDNDYEKVISNLNQEIRSYNNFTVGLRLHAKMCPKFVLEVCQKLNSRNVALIHTDFNPDIGFVNELWKRNNVEANIFILDDCGRLYVKRYERFNNKVLIRDGKKYKNELNSYPDFEFFSDLHITYKDYNAKGFGDYLMIGKNAKDTFRNPLISSIHLTFLDHERDNAMYTYHFISDTDKKYFDPTSIFLSALSKLIKFIDSSKSIIYETSALHKFRKLAENSYFPGSGYINQLSIRHHIETLAYYSKLEKVI